jgi:hypothetical protein
MATLAVGNIVYTTVETGLLVQSPMFGNVETVTGSPDLVTVAWPNGINQTFKSTDTNVNRLAVKDTDPDAATILGKRFKVSANEMIGTVIDSWLVGATRMVMLLVPRPDPRDQFSAERVTTLHYLITSFASGAIL